MAEPATPGAIHALLRHATRAAHHALDHHPLLAGLLDDGLDLPRYARSLAALHGAFAVAEAVVQAGTSTGPAYLPRVPRLDADLAALGCVPMPFTGTIAAPADAAGRIGMLYVLEGSALGGQFIARRLRTTLGESCPCSFFGGEGEQACAARWQRFIGHAEAICANGGGDRAATAAVALFASFRAHLDAVDQSAG